MRNVLRRKQPFVADLLNTNTVIPTQMILLWDSNYGCYTDKHNQINKIILNNRDVQVREIFDFVKISMERIHDIWHEYSDMNAVFVVGTDFAHN